MSIAAANLFTRNIYKEYLKRDATPAQEATMSKIVSLIVKAGAVLFILLIDPQFSIDLQLIGGVIILQTLPSVALGLYTGWFHRWGLVAGWVAGMGLGMWMLYEIPNAATKHAHFGGSAFPLNKWFDPTTIGLDARTTVYVGFVAVLANLLVAAIITAICKAVKAPDGVDLTTSDDYFADEGDPRIAGPTVDDLTEPAPVR
jgi:SSS family solute:Na+ symporter